METQTSAFLLLFRELDPDVYSGMTAGQRAELMDAWNAWYDGLAARGQVQHGHPLLPQARVVSGPKGERIVDGPFSEAKEAIGGYFMLTVSSFDEATEIAQRCPSLPYGMHVEVRQVADACPSLGVKGRAVAAAGQR